MPRTALEDLAFAGTARLRMHDNVSYLAFKITRGKPSIFGNYGNLSRRFVKAIWSWLEKRVGRYGACSKKDWAQLQQRFTAMLQLLDASSWTAASSWHGIRSTKKILQHCSLI